MQTSRFLGTLAAACLVALSSAATALTGPDITSKLEARFRHDRTGACVVAASVDGKQVARATYCALPRADGGPGLEPAFEIGSITKTMTAFLVADLIDQGKWSLDDPIAKHLPAATVVPQQGKRRILVRDLVTHSSGLPALPSRLRPADPANPFADFSEQDLLASLGEAPLARPIGSQAEYSNFAMMVLSFAVARAYGTEFEAALKSRLLEPAQMQGAFIAKPTAGAKVAVGHTPWGAPTAAWTIAPNLAGVGLVKATLDDMVKYVQAELGSSDTPLSGRMRMTQQPLAHGFGMNWVRATVKGHDLLLHEGGTGGFSALVAMEPARQRAVVVLADTALTDLGGLGDIGLVLLGIDVPLRQPRIAAPIPATLRAAIQGDYELAGLSARIWDDGGHLMGQAAGQAAFELLFDDHGDFYPTMFSALLTPIMTDGKVNAFAWRQGGGVLEGVRKGSRRTASAENPLWKDWAGEYRLAPRFSLRVFEEGGRLKVQGTAQPAIDAEVVEQDRIEIKAVGATVQFNRDGKGAVVSATLRQKGQVLEGRKE
jgi:serine-type D-Ala-D-Ala carboxypeptidase/endopeptidase